ncbi:cystathionine gamma-synthase [Cellulosimicrobium funkei]|uniref:Cystathionine gamma-synthase n=1 Tax=Cellulosimicrobium funkei TaxID=264251 RepID=A0A0H2KQG6_9MICO|nr:cystathionine gamma-synthase [Cellulosimicrobium funkei]KLN35413.1 cystathionine gamma-synthase [Cellulosimicrobium funkei]
MTTSSEHPDWTTTGFSTRAIHAGQDPDATTGAVVPPIHQVSTYKQDGVGGLRGGYEYSRSANPTRTALEEALAAAESGGLRPTADGSPAARGFAFASGLAAEDTLLRAVVRPGDHVIVPDDAYGGTYRLIARVFGPWGVEHTPVDLTDVEAVRAAVRPETRVVWVETPTNPLLGVSDIAALAGVAHDAGALLVVDNTFATPYLQQPLALGADVVVHSTTKYVGGHSDVVGGALVVASGAQLPGGLASPAGGTDVAGAVGFHQNASGAIAGPFDAWLTLRGLKTLAVRMDRHQANAAAVADFLAAHPAVTEVIYPGLASHPGHELAARQMSGFGGMVSFRAGSEAKALDVCARTQVFALAESLGGVESLIEHPGRMTHGSVAGTALEVPDDLVRLSVGIEDVEDLVADLTQALA